jgi:site-specific recombinase XerD
VADFSAASKSVAVLLSKSGKSRHIALTNEGVNLFSKIVSDKTAEKPIFLRDDQEEWGASHQQRRLEDASDRAQIDPPVNFHILRHTYASALAMNGAPMAVIAAQLGHVGTRITEKHYAHLAPTYVGDTVRATLPSMGGLGE